MQVSFYNKARETRSQEERRSELTRSLLQTCQHAYSSSSAYKEIFDSAGIQPSLLRGLEDLERLPLIRMAELVERQRNDPPFGGFALMDPPEGARIYANPGFLWQPGESGHLSSSWAEALVGGGFRSGDRILNTFSYHLWSFAFAADEAARIIGATVIPAGPGNTLVQIRIMQMLRVQGYLGTPSFLMTLIQRAEAMGTDLKKDLALKTALVAGEMLPESLRNRLQDRLNITVRQAYGTVFLGCIGYECPFHAGLHIPEGLLVEVVDPATGIQVEPGMPGEIVATNFSPLYPMIRMATGDLSMLSWEPCPCGRTGPMLKRIIGRIDQAAKVRGTFIHPWQTDEVISRHSQVYKYQVVITREEYKDMLTFIIELKEDMPQPRAIAARIEKDIKELLGIRGVVEVVPRGTIPDQHKKIDDRREWQ